jgi:hypothetical protein
VDRGGDGSGASTAPHFVDLKLHGSSNPVDTFMINMGVPVAGRSRTNMHKFIDLRS